MIETMAPNASQPRPWFFFSRKEAPSISPPETSDQAAI